MNTQSPAQRARQAADRCRRVLGRLKTHEGLRRERRVRITASAASGQVSGAQRN